MTARKLPKIGDIIEIKTKKGLAYALYSHEHKDGKIGYGSLIRILPGFRRKRPTDFSKLVQKPEAFAIFTYLRYAVKKGIFQIVAHVPLPDWAKAFPQFRSSYPDKDGNFSYWWIWDGKNNERVERNDPRVRFLSDKGLSGEDFLIDLIERKYRPEDSFILATGGSK